MIVGELDGMIHFKRNLRMSGEHYNYQLSACYLTYLIQKPNEFGI